MRSRRSPAPARSGNPSPNRATVAIGFVRGILAGLAFRPNELRIALKHAELATLDLDASNLRVGLAQYNALYRHLVEALDDEAFGLLSRPLRPGCFAWVAQSALQAKCLADALQALCHQFNLLQDNLRFEWQPAGAGASLRATVVQALPVGPEGFAFAHEWLLRLILGLGAWLVAQPLQAERAAFPYPAPAHASDYELLYAPRIDFEAPALAAHFPADALALPVRRDRADLCRFLTTAPASITLLYRDEALLAPRVRRVLREALPEFVGLGQAASRLGLSSRTLHRRLVAEGTSYRALREELRHALACDWLARGDKRVTDIALDLGYADNTAFYRAFAQWEGCGPRRWRQRRIA